MSRTYLCGNSWGAAKTLPLFLRRNHECIATGNGPESHNSVVHGSGGCIVLVRCRVFGSLLLPKHQECWGAWEKQQGIFDIFSPSSLVTRKLTWNSICQKLRQLNLTSCYQVEDVESLLWIDTLILSHCYRVRKIGTLRGTKHLDISHAHFISDVSTLGDLESLNLEGCVNISDASALSRLRWLNITFCDKIDPFSLSNIPELITQEDCTMEIWKCFPTLFFFKKNARKKTISEYKHTLFLWHFARIPDIVFSFLQTCANRISPQKKSWLLLSWILSARHVFFFSFWHWYGLGNWRLIPSGHWNSNQYPSL